MHLLKYHRMSGIQCVAILIAVILLLSAASAYNCSTRNEELGVASEFEAAQNYRLGFKWPGGVVKYYLNSSLESRDIQEFYLAVEEYHKKTCIRFEPKQAGDENYTSIEVDPMVCGFGSVCMRGGYQYTKIGNSCRKMNTLVHELGHNICLGHEHQRSDRDEYINYDKCNITKHGKHTEKQMNNAVRGIYDYSSQMHYDCGECSQGGFPSIPGVKLCGSQVTKGLSILDADYINEMYDCQGCFRHRWIPKRSLKSIKNNFLNLGHRDLNQVDIVPCRTFLNGEVVVGKYNNKYSACFVAQNGKEHSEYEEFEVLTVPDENPPVSEYYLAKVVGGNLPAVVSNAVPAGHLVRADGSGYGNEYIAYGTLYNVEKSCPFEYSARNESANVIGNVVWSNNGANYAYFPFCKQQHQLLDYHVLSCRNTRLNDTGHNEGKDIYKNWKLRHMEAIKGTLAPGSTVTVIGSVNADAQTFFVDLSERPSSGRIILHYNPRFNWNSMKNITVSNSLSAENWMGVIPYNHRENFPYVKGQTFKLVIRCEDGVFNYSVNGFPAGKYAYRQPLKGAKFVRVHGDVTVIHVDIRDTENACEDGVRKSNGKGMGGDKMMYLVYGVIVTIAVIGLFALYVVVRVVLRLAGNKARRHNNNYANVPFVYIREQTM